MKKLSFKSKKKDKKFFLKKGHKTKVRMYNKFKRLEEQEEDEEEIEKKKKKELKDKKKKKEKKGSKKTADKGDGEGDNGSSSSDSDYHPKSSVNKRNREKRQKRRSGANASSDSDEGDDTAKGKVPQRREPVPSIVVVDKSNDSDVSKANASTSSSSSSNDVTDKKAKKKSDEKKKSGNDDDDNEDEKDSVISVNELEDFDVDDSRKKKKKKKGGKFWKSSDDVSSTEEGGKKKKKKKWPGSKLAEKLGFKKESEPDRPLTFGEKVDKFFTLSGETRFIGFGISFGLGLISIMASFIFLEDIVEEPSPFCILYSVGFLFLIASTFFLLGPCRQIRHLMKPCRFVCATVFFITLILTLVMAIAIEDTTLTIVSLVIQFIAFGLYVISLCPCIQKCCSGMCTLIV